jgi:hypothetical protein
MNSVLDDVPVAVVACREAIGIGLCFMSGRANVRYPRSDWLDTATAEPCRGLRATAPAAVGNREVYGDHDLGRTYVTAARRISKNSKCRRSPAAFSLTKGLGR